MIPDPFAGPPDPDSAASSDLETKKLILNQLLGEVREMVSEHVTDLESKGLTHDEAVAFGHALHAKLIEQL